MRYVLVGAGQRGMIYAKYLKEKFAEDIVAIAEPNDLRLAEAAKILDVESQACYHTAEELLEEDKLADVMILATMDKQHYAHAKLALEKGYDLLLEKPISPDGKECAELEELANRLKRKVVVCHVLRYTSFFSTLKQIVDSGELGRVLTIQHIENIGNFHMAHSFVRGNWRRADLSSPIILQKTSHDFDILAWLVGSQARYLSSLGNLTYFKTDNAPEGSGKRCLDCPVAENCRFDAKKAYLPIVGSWPATVVSEIQTEDAILEALSTGPYGKCVYKTDNDVCDHQVTNIEFENDVTVSMHLSAFNNKIQRSIKIMCEDGEIIGDDVSNIITINYFSSNNLYEASSRTIQLAEAEGGHGGGDLALIEDAVHVFNTDEESRSSISQSMESHYMAFAAEKSRIEKCVIDMSELKKDLLN